LSAWQAGGDKPERSSMTRHSFQGMRPPAVRNRMPYGVLRAQPSNRSRALSRATLLCDPPSRVGYGDTLAQPSMNTGPRRSATALPTLPIIFAGPDADDVSGTAISVRVEHLSCPRPRPWAV